MTPSKIYFHRVHGAKLLYVFDGDRACREHPNEWSDKPWTDAAAQVAEEYDREAKERQGVVEAPRPRIPDGPILAALALLSEYEPTALSDAGRQRHQAEVDRHAARDARVQLR